MRAALIREVGIAPEPGEAPEPDGAVVEVLAAPINPIDLAVSRGILATGHPTLPYVPGCEDLDRVSVGSRRVADLGHSSDLADERGSHYMPIA